MDVLVKTVLYVPSKFNDNSAGLNIMECFTEG